MPRDVRFADLDLASQTICKARYGAFAGDGCFYLLNGEDVCIARIHADPRAPACYAVLARARPGRRIVMVVAGQREVLSTSYDSPDFDIGRVRETVEQLNARLGVNEDAKNELLAQAGFDATIVM